MIVTHHALTALLFMLFVDQVYGASFVTEPNKTTVVTTGSNQTFTWQLNLTNQEKLKQLQVQFGPWNKDLDIIAGSYLVTFIQEPSANGSVLLTTNHSIVKRLQWVGDLTRDYFAAFKLFDVKLSDFGDYGIRFRVEFFPIVTLESWFTLSVQDPFPLPTKPPASSLQCYQCIREQGPDADKYCEISPSSLGNNSKVNCSGGDSRCIITKTIQKDNSVTQFRRGCGTDEGCTDECIADGDGVNVCHSCCEEDLCNKGNGPKAAEQSGTSRLTMTRGLSALGGFLLWCLL